MLRLSEAFHPAPAEAMWRQLVFFDIETTGFSRQYHQVGLISLGYVKDGHWQIDQYFANSSADESLIITAALSQLQQHLAWVSYNGDSFDIPFLHSRAKQLKLGSRLPAGRSIDLYRLLKRGRLKQTEADSGFDRQDSLSGADWARLYKDYLRQPDEAVQEKLLLHCRDDILSLIQLLESHQILRQSIEHRLLYQPAGLILDIIPSPSNLRVRWVDLTNETSQLDLPLIDTPDWSVLDDPSFDDLSPAEKQALVLIEHKQVQVARVRNVIQNKRAAD